MIESALLEILACPICDSRPRLRIDGGWMVCTEVGHGFPIVDGIPHLLPEEAIDAKALEKLMHGR